MSTTPQTPKQPKAGLYLQRKLFDGIARFTDLEQRIADLPTEQERGDAFEVFVEAYLSTQPLHQAKTVWPFSAIPLARIIHDGSSRNRAVAKRDRRA